MHLTPVDSPYLVPFDGFFSVDQAPTTPPEGAPKSKGCRKALKARKRLLADLQHRLYAHNRYGVLLVFQAMDAAGKDSTIRRVLSGVNPAGCQVSSFKRPSTEELDHDFLWRTARRLPERGCIGVFNRSYYEEVLVARVDERVIEGQRLPASVDRERLWEHRYASIRDHEQHLARNGFIVLKFWLNVSEDEQARRLLRRIDDPHRNWKFSSSDIATRALWPEHMHAYEEALNATSRPWAPWYAVPADDKDFLRMTVADIVVRALERLNLRYPELATEERARLEEMRLKLEADLDGEGEEDDDEEIPPEL